MGVQKESIVGVRPLSQYEASQTSTLKRRFLAWAIHAFTASGAVIGVFTLLAIYHHKLLLALWLMCATIAIDAVDGMFARAVNVKKVLPNVDGALLDNIVDFLNYTIVPCFFLLVTNLLPPYWRDLCVSIIVFASAYQFTQVDAKTTDHFFKGFPSYWNITVFYLFFYQLDPMTNLGLLLTLAVLSFIPVKYIYPSRVDYLTDSSLLRAAMVVGTVIWGAANAGLLWLFPETNHFLVAISLIYCLLYFGFSLYRTWVPLPSLALAE